MFKKTTHLVLVMLALIIGSSQICAQDNTVEKLSLAAAIESANVGNQQIQVAKYNHEASLWDIKSMKSAYLPKVDVSMMASVTNLPLHTFGSTLQQGGIEQSDFIPASLNSPDAVTNLLSKVNILQPIINMDIAEMKRASISKSMALEMQISHTQNTLAFNIRQTYLQLQLTYKVVEVLEKAKVTAQANLKIINDNVDAGYLHKSDLLSVELRINQLENQLYEARSNILNASDQLSFLMGAGYGTRYVPTDSLVYNEDQDTEMLTDIAQRADVKSLKYQIEAQQHQLASIKKSTLPRLNAMGSYELNNPLDFANNQHGYLVGLNASWNIFDGNKKKHSQQKAKINLEMNKTNLSQMMSRINLKIQQTRRIISESKNKISLSKSAIAQSKEVLRIKTDRFEEGLETTTDLLNAETDLAQMQMNYVEAVYHYQNSIAELKYLTEKEN